ncbi:MAG: hypothetical protein GWN37_12435 [Gammaproteobacteria bacterium]|nr:hypothetical protein [Gammaproteobacteria bacterium]
MKITTIGIDTAKRVFEVHGVDERGARVVHKRLARAKVLPFPATLAPWRAGLEACAGARYWGRRLAELGHEPKRSQDTPGFRRKSNALTHQPVCRAHYWTPAGDFILPFGAR